jgi:hypothetical protein
MYDGAAPDFPPHRACRKAARREAPEARHDMALRPESASPPSTAIRVATLSANSRRRLGDLPKPR